MTPSHRRNRVKIAGRWVLPGTIVQATDVDGNGTGGPVRVVMRRIPGDRCVRLLDPSTGEVLFMNDHDMVAPRVRIVE